MSTSRRTQRRAGKLAATGHPTSRIADMKWGLGKGIVLAIGCTTLAFIGSAAGANDQEGVVPRLLAVYWGGGLASGTLAGLLRRELYRPRVRWLAAIVAVSPLMLALVTAALGAPVQWQTLDWILWAGASTYGGVVALLLYTWIASRLRPA
jgi:hypothetical protein